MEQQSKNFGSSSLMKQNEQIQKIISMSKHQHQQSDLYSFADKNNSYIVSSKTNSHNSNQMVLLNSNSKNNDQFNSSSPFMQHSIRFNNDLKVNSEQKQLQRMESVKFGTYVVSQEATPKSRKEQSKEEDSEDNLSFKLRDSPSTRKSRDQKKFAISQSQ